MNNNDENHTDEDFRVFCNNAIITVTELRFVESKVGPHSAPSQVMEELWDVRVRIDQIEELLLQTYRLKEKLKRAYIASKAIYEDKWDEEYKRVSNNITSRMGDYTSARERAAEINLKLLDFKRSERLANELSSTANETYEYIKIAHNGIDAVKHDLQSIIRVYQIESSLGGRR